MPAEAVAPAPAPVREALRQFVRSPSGLIGAAILLLIIGASVVGPMLYRVDPFDIVAGPFDPPSADALLGADYLGRDVLAGLLLGGRTTLLVGLVAALMTVAIGISIGAVAGYVGGLADRALMKLTEFFQVLPALLFAMVLVTLFGARIWIEVLAIGAVAWTGVARLTRAEALRIRELDFVRAAIVGGGGPAHLILRVVLPNALPPIVVASTLAIGVAILFESGLAFLGLGDPNVMSWGLMLGENRDYLLTAWWAVTFPGLAIFLAVLAVSLLGDGLNDALDPRGRRR